MKAITKNEFKKEKIVKMCYVYGIKTSDGETIEKVYYLRYVDDKNRYEERSWDVQSFAKKILNAEWIAYAGKREGSGDSIRILNPSLVTIKTIDGVLYLTTASDDAKCNNLLNLPKYDW